MRLVLVISSTRSSLLCVRRGRATTTVVRSRTADSSIGGEVAALLSESPSRIPWRARVDVLLDGIHSQVRCLEGLPDLDGLEEVTAMVRESPFAFFFRTASALKVSDVHRASDGQRWGAAFEASAVDGITKSAREHKYRLGRIAARCVSASAPPELHVADSNPLTAIESPLALRSVRVSARLRRASLLLATSGVIASGAFAYLAPGLHASLLLRQQRTARGTQSSSVAAMRELQNSSAIVEGVDRLDARRGRMTRFLVALARTLPKSANAPSIRVDSSDASLTIVAARVDEVLDAIDAHRLINEARFVGGLNRTTTADADRNRVTIRGHLPASFR